MYNNYKIIAFTFAGRKRFMEILIPYVLFEDIIDRWDIIINTDNQEDIEYLNTLNKYPKIKLITTDRSIKYKVPNIQFSPLYKNFDDDSAIYLKFDDDICFIEKDCIQKLIKFRIENPQYWIVHPLTINNGGCNFILDVQNKLTIDKHRYLEPDDFRHFMDSKADSAIIAHIKLLKIITENKCNELYIKPIIYNMFRVSINTIAFFGRDPLLKFFNSLNQDRDDEEWFTDILPILFCRSNCIFGEGIVAHYAFGNQMKSLNETNILEQYKNIQNLNSEVFTWKIKNSYV
jgi:hypothetical protein